ncbi:hypothetical protein MNB_SV-4-1333 [hydrothermal vent metagenome]|uniref:Uncharacterized protein n=1 Tax=hydrothermal vent metagenome TaxID=652676 RepID=A0A1W1E953_9ZZZZ
MSSSLEKLKALTSKLEEKLEQKQGKTATPAAQTTATKQTTKTPKKPATAESVSSPDTAPLNTAPKTQPKPIKKAEPENVRQENIDRVKALYEKLKIFEKSPDFDNIFYYKAMNLSGIGLKEEDFAQVREGKYIQIIAITYEPDKNGKKKAKNISLGYFGKAETLDEKLKNEIIEFVLRWRYEKAFQNVEHYKALIEKIDIPTNTLF